MDKRFASVGVAADEGAMRRYGRSLAPLLAAGDVVVLSGGLGAGKTHFSQGVAAGLGVGATAVSPTFNVVLAYDDGRLPLYHFDLYRLQDAGALEDVDFYALAGEGSDGAALVEWGMRFPDQLPSDYLEVALTVEADGRRGLGARPCGPRAEELLAQWRAALAGSAAPAAADGHDGDALPEGAGPDGRAGSAAAGGAGLEGAGGDAAPGDAAGAEGAAWPGEVAARPVEGARYVLAFDTANEVVAIGLGLLDEAARAVVPVATRQVRAHRASNTQLLPLIDGLLAEAAVVRGRLACVAVGVGPGSFTGVRIACATAKGIASALGLGLVGVSTLNAVAWGAQMAAVRGEVLVVADAMRKEVYPVRYRLADEDIGRQGPDRVAKAREVAEELAGAGLQVAGDGLSKYGELFERCGTLLDEELWAPTGLGLLRALQESWRAGEADPLDGERHAPGMVLPVYTRLSDAEEHERARLAKADPRNLRTGVQDAPAPDGGIGRATLHSAAVLTARVDGAGVVYAPLDSDHVGAVAALEAQAMGTDGWNEALVADELGRPDRLWWMALAGGELVGYAGGLVVDGGLQVLKVAVRPEWRRRGLARTLLAKVAEDARNLGAREASLEVRASNRGAQALYEALGLQAIGTRPRYYSDREDATIMAGPLDALVGAGAEARVAGMAIERHGTAAASAAAGAADRSAGAAGPGEGPERPLILAIESSCDETAAALVDGTGALLSDVVASQVDFHGRFGGVVPEIASRKHIEAICGVCDECLDAASSAVAPGPPIRWGDLSAVAATYAPGLVGALVVGVAFAKGAAWALDVPYVEVNHLEGHLYANKLAGEGFAPPAVVSLVSGGNTMLVSMADYGDYCILGETIDDAVGEAFDKVAKALGLGYPGGPAISRLAAEGDPGAIDFPRAMLHSGDLRFSLSGLKTAVMNYLSQQRQAGRPLSLPDVCASFQQAVIDVQVAKARAALRQTGALTLCLGGGVAANPGLRQAYEELCAEMGVRLVMPPLQSCGDNAGMIALVALDRFRAGRTAPLSADAFAHRSLEDPY